MATHTSRLDGFLFVFGGRNVGWVGMRVDPAGVGGAGIDDQFTLQEILKEQKYFSTVS